MIFWSKKRIQKAYISEIDQFLQVYDKKPESSSVSRKAEEAKYKEIARLRDGGDQNHGQ